MFFYYLDFKVVRSNRKLDLNESNEFLLHIQAIKVIIKSGKMTAHLWNWRICKLTHFRGNYLYENTFCLNQHAQWCMFISSRKLICYIDWIKWMFRSFFYADTSYVSCYEFWIRLDKALMYFFIKKHDSFSLNLITTTLSFCNWIYCLEEFVHWHTDSNLSS